MTSKPNEGSFPERHAFSEPNPANASEGEGKPYVARHFAPKAGAAERKAAEKVDSGTDTVAPASVSSSSSGEPVMKSAGQPSGQAAGRSSDPAPAPSAETPLIRKKIQRHTKRKRALRVAAVVLVVLLLIGCGAAYAVHASVNAGREAFEQTAKKAKKKRKTGQITYNGHTYELNEHMATVCFIGFDYQHYDDEGKARTRQSDTVMVAALNTETGKATAIVIPRDSMVDVDVYSNGSYVGQEQQQIALQFAYGDGADGSAALVAKTASRVLYDMPIDYYFALDINGVGPINDAVGGVTVNPLMTIPGTPIAAGQEVTLFGKNAEKYVQYRDSQGTVSDSTTSALDRQARQVQYLQAFVGQVLSSARSNPTSMISLYQTATQYTYTNLGVNEFTYLASTMLDKGITQFDFKSLPGEQVQNGTLAEFHLDKDGVRQMVIDTFYHRADE